MRVLRCESRCGMEPCMAKPTTPLGDKINEYMRANGLKRHEFAALLNVSPQAVYYWVHGMRTPTEYQRELATLLGVPIAFVRGDEEVAPPIPTDKHGAVAAILDAISEAEEKQSEMCRLLTEARAAIVELLKTT